MSCRSGKSLVYNAPVLSSIERDPSVTALYLFPTKALAQDQLRSLKGLVHSSPALRQRVQCWWVLCGAWDCHDTPTLAHLCSCVCVCVCVCVCACVRAPVLDDQRVRRRHSPPSAQQHPRRRQYCSHQPRHATPCSFAPPWRVGAVSRVSALASDRRGAHVSACCFSGGLHTSVTRLPPHWQLCWCLRSPCVHGHSPTAACSHHVWQSPTGCGLLRHYCQPRAPLPAAGSCSDRDGAGPEVAACAHCRHVVMGLAQVPACLYQMARNGNHLQTNTACGDKVRPPVHSCRLAAAPLSSQPVASPLLYLCVSRSPWWMQRRTGLPLVRERW